MGRFKFKLALQLASLLVCWLVLASLAQAEVKTEAKEYLVLGTGGVTGVYYPTGGAICSLVNNTKQHQLRCSAETTAGSEFNLTALQQGTLDFALVQSDVHYNAYKGEEKFASQGPFTQLRSVFSLHVEAMTFVTKQSNPANKFSDLKNQSVSLGNLGSGQRLTLELMLKEMGEDLSFFSAISELRAADMPTALCNNKIDAMSYLVGHPNSSIKEATNNCKSKILNLDEELINKLLISRPYYIKTIIAGQEYANNPKDITSFGVLATFVTLDTMSENNVYQLVKSVFENFETFKKRHPAFTNLTKQSMVASGLTAPLHPGALKYYREAGLIN